MRVTFACLALALLLSGCHTGLRAWLLGYKPEYAGKPDPAYKLASVEGRPESLAAFRGKIVLLNMWATWCPPCRAEIPALERYARENKGRGIVVVGVDQGENPGTVARFARAAGMTYPILLDPRQRYWKYYDVTAIPTTVVIDRSGKPVKAYFGEFDSGTVGRIIASIPR